jgi:DNA-binding NarL/FixJ family response regulator
MRRISVCLYGVHPLVLSEFQRLLGAQRFRLRAIQVRPNVVPDLAKIPSAAAYIVDLQNRRGATEALIAGILARQPGARILVVADEFEDANAFPLLRLGTKGLLSYTQAIEVLPSAVMTVARGGFWVPRELLSRFVESTLHTIRRPTRVSSFAEISRREREVLEGLLENLSNKEIAGRLHISERTAKFHVSNLLAKYGVKRRADLILLSL